MNNKLAKTLVAATTITSIFTPIFSQVAISTTGSSNGVFGLEVHYLDSALQCGSNPTQADIKVYVYDQDNNYLTTMSKGDKYLSSSIDSVNDLVFKYKIYNLTCIANGSWRSPGGTELLDSDDPVPDIGGFSDQASIAQMLSGLDSYEELYLVELGTSDENSTAYDLQDVVLVVDNNPTALNNSTPTDSDADNNGILDKDELDGDVDNDGIANYLDLDDDGDNIADVMELHTASAISNTGTSEMPIFPGAELTVTLPNPPEINITPSEAINTDLTDNPDYQDSDSDNDTISDRDEAGDEDLATTPVNSDSDNVLDFQDSDSDNNGILDLNEHQGDIDSDGKDNYQDDDDDGDNIPDVIEIGSNPNAPLNSDGNLDDGADYQDTNSDDDLWLDADEGIESASSKQTTTTITVNYPAGDRFQFRLRDWKDYDTINTDGTNNTTRKDMTITVTSEANGKVNITGTMTGLEYQIPTFGD